MPLASIASHLVRARVHPRPPTLTPNVVPQGNGWEEGEMGRCWGRGWIAALPEESDEWEVPDVCVTNSRELSMTGDTTMPPRWDLKWFLGAAVAINMALLTELGGGNGVRVEL